MPFMFGRGRRSSKSTAGYTGPGVSRAGGSMSALTGGTVMSQGGRNMPGPTTSAMGAARMPGEYTPAAGQILREPISARPTTSMYNERLATRVTAPRRVKANVAASQEARRARQAAQARAEFGGGMGMGIPQGARGAGGLPPMLARNEAMEFGTGMGMGVPANAVKGSQNIPMTARNYVTPFGDMGMGVPSNAVKGSQNIPMIERPSEQRLRVLGNINRSKQTRAARNSARSSATTRAVRDAPNPTAPVRGLIEDTGKKSKNLFHGKGLAIGLGAAVIAGLAYSGRRGEGSSGGRTSQYRY